MFVCKVMVVGGTQVRTQDGREVLMLLRSLEEAFHLCSEASSGSWAIIAWLSAWCGDEGPEQGEWIEPPGLRSVLADPSCPGQCLG